MGFGPMPVGVAPTATAEKRPDVVEAKPAAEATQAVEERQMVGFSGIAWIVFLVLILLLLGTWGGQLWGV